MWKSMTLPAGFWKSFGPGLVWAAAAIGVSHLVQATRAGALAGFGLAGVILLALVLKYPFFEYGPRYAAATGRSLVEGYRRIGRWALWLYFTITVVTAVIHQVAIILFLSFLFQFAFPGRFPRCMGRLRFEKNFTGGLCSCPFEGRRGGACYRRVNPCGKA